MSGHHVQREQRRFRLIAVATIVTLALVLMPVLLLSELRLEIAHRLGWVPSNAEQLFGDGDPVELIVLVQETPNPYSGPSRQYTAVYIAEWTENAIRLHDLMHGGTHDLPITRYDLISGAADQSALLFVDKEAPGGAEAAMITLATGEVRSLPKGETDPGLPGNWDEEVSFGNIGCSGVSPDKAWVACIVHGGTRLFFGDWELIVHRFGRSDEAIPLYRGLGSDPVVGWAPGGDALYFQNEQGLWRSDLTTPAG